MPTAPQQENGATTSIRPPLQTLAPHPGSSPTDSPSPSFSFTKKPIRSSYQRSAITSKLSDVTPQTEPSLPKTVLNTTNYDEQIRAPRMSTTSAASYVYDVGVPRPFDPSLQTSESEDGRKQCSHDSSDKDDCSSASQTPYHPAAVDLNAPTRRNLAPLRLSLSGISSSFLTDAQKNFLGQTGNTSQSLSGSSASSTASTNPYLKGSQAQALVNLNENRISTEQNSRDAYPYGLHRKHAQGHMIDAKGPGLQQLYESKRPLCTPAVLRPLNDRNASYVGSMDLEPSTPLHDHLQYPFQIDFLEDNEDNTSPGPVEPTHDHWVPDSSTDHCTKCFAVFGNFLSGKSKRRHHCRFCGMLFCMNCLYKNTEFAFCVAPESRKQSQVSEGSRSPSHSSSHSGHLRISSIILAPANEDYMSGVMMDTKCRLVVPIFENFSQCQSAAMLQKFKVSKICKDCGSNYAHLVHALNLSIQDESLDIGEKCSFVFIENPYLQGHLKRHPSTDRGLPAGGTNNFDFEERRTSTNNVPVDWTWSSF